MRALISVSDKRGVVQFARELVALKWEIVSTGGTAEALRREGIPVIPIDQVTGFPEMMDGRVKTLHPKVHGGLLGRRDNQNDMAAMQQHGITPIDLVAVNLYPFRETVAKRETTFAQAIEQIDIGGPSMLRSAAKNQASVIVIVDPDDYSSVIEDLKVGEVGEDKRRALATKVFARTAAFGSVIAFNTVVDRAAAEAMRELFVEVVVAPRVDADALAVFKEKKNLRVVELPKFADDQALDYKRVRGGFLVQDRFRYSAVADESKWRVATIRRPTDAQWNDLRFAWAAVGSIKSNAIILVKDEAAIGIGAGQMSRVDSSFLAVHKARQQGHDPREAVLASDAFFPFPDGVEEAAAAGVSAVIQPGGSVKDAEVIAAADQHDLAMILTGMRQFRH